MIWDVALLPEPINHKSEAVVRAQAIFHAEVMLGTPSIAGALVRRASKGNVPAAKLAMEASGFHNPRVKHEHTGDIKVTIDNAPRPPVVEDDVVDGTVVE
jgi:hypothetical protein